MQRVEGPGIVRIGSPGITDLGSRGWVSGRPRVEAEGDGLLDLQSSRLKAERVRGPEIMRIKEWDNQGGGGPGSLC